MADTLTWLRDIVRPDPQHWPKDINAAATKASDTFETWAHSRGLSGVTAQLWFWIALASVFLILTIWALLNVRAALVAKRRRQKQEPSDDTEPTGQIPALAQPVDDFEVPDTIRGYLTFGTVLALLLVGGGGAWAALTEIAGAVLASGTVVVDSKVKKVQHPTGGIVGEIHVKDGDTVKLGDLLLRLDDTATNANLQSITKQLDELAVRQARLLSERDGKMRSSFHARSQAVWPTQQSPLLRGANAACSTPADRLDMD